MQGDGEHEVDAPLAGMVTEVKVSIGDSVTSGQEVAVIESMKMFHGVKAAVSGRVCRDRCFRRSGNRQG